MPTPSKIVFIKQGLFSYSNVSVLAQLKKQLPQYEVEEFDLQQVLRRSRRLRLLGYAHAYRHYGGDILRGRRSRWDCLYQTGFMMREIKRRVGARLAPNREQYTFTFQTQSIFDASVEGLPHFVYTDHTNLANLYYGEAGRGRLFPPYWHALERVIYEKATRVFTMGEHVRRSVVEHYGCPPGKVECVGAGSNIALDPLPLDNDGYKNQRILFVGVEWERKGGPLLMEAFRAVLAEFPNARLTIVGCHPRIEAPNVEVVGRLPLEEVNRRYAQSSIFCLPTRAEPFGIVFIEAMLRKLPVIAPRLGAMPDFIEDGVSGLLVPPNDVGAWRAALAGLLASPEKCRRLGENGRTVAKDRYTWDAVGESMKRAIEASLKSEIRSSKSETNSKSE